MEARVSVILTSRYIIARLFISYEKLALHTRITELRCVLILPTTQTTQQYDDVNLKRSFNTINKTNVALLAVPKTTSNRNCSSCVNNFTRVSITTASTILCIQVHNGKCDYIEKYMITSFVYFI